MYQLRISLMGSSPEIWRRLDVSGDIRLDRFHEVLQAVMGWKHIHLHEFRAGGRRYLPSAAEVPKGEDETRFMLRSIATKEGYSFLYIYDFGDCWRHTITVEKIGTGAESLPPKCLEGEGACPPENCGGMGGYEEQLKRLRKAGTCRVASINSRVGKVKWR